MTRSPLAALLAAALLLPAAGCGKAEENPAPTPPPEKAAPAKGDTAGAAPASASKGPARMEPDPAFLTPAGNRTFSVTYTAKVKDIPAGTKTLRVWVPVPRDSEIQSITGLSFDGPVEPTVTEEPKFGNRLAYYEVSSPGATFETKVSYTVARKELITDLARLAADGQEAGPLPAPFLEADRLTVVDDRIRKMAAEAVAGKTATLDRARALYEKVFEHMTYDKSGTGWGRGDTNFACDVGKGNCTDFHALFMSLCRAEGIAAGFEIGLYPPYEKYVDQPLGGYHCWAWFRVPGKTWVPVDISEADRDPARKDYFFGSHTPNRVTLSTGRFYDLEPRQAGDPINFLLNPYAEADGREVPTGKDWGMKDLE